MTYYSTLAVALVFANVFIFGDRLRANSHHRRWISIAAGVSVGSVFLDLLPEISERQVGFSNRHDLSTAMFPEQAIFLAAMVGFVLFYGLQFLIVPTPSVDAAETRTFANIRLAAFALYSSLIAYLLVHSVWTGAAAFFFYSLAMAFHFLLVDHSLAGKHEASYKTYGRWILALSVMAGWSAGMLTSIPEDWLARVSGFICGGVIMNTLVVELPEGKGGRFWPFVLAASGYSLVLILVMG